MKPAAHVRDSLCPSSTDGQAVDARMRPALEDLVGRYGALDAVRDEMGAAGELLARTFRGGNKVLCCGNGGSAADASHIVGELMKSMTRPRVIDAEERAALLGHGDLGRYLAEHLEGALPAIDLGCQHALITAIGNDTAGDMLFAQQVEGYGKPGDLLWALSTSGTSRNVVLAAITAQARGVAVLVFTGADESPLSRLATVSIRVPAQSVQAVQELHLPIYHTLCEVLECSLFDELKSPDVQSPRRVPSNPIASSTSIPDR